ncbi:MAG: tRNA preQ1(34) S-adenosylmethionine ribosyltransferase-isomerase QueA [Gammaproteobacteria bacterium]|nr:tRNA preQ1(34) S-adenosylmethionine ribosyltransferase-isomerase QueA [Gammaproteobacteria bacterium]MDH3449377.1 tRNA preQ1(34) S-adenosylmethionine ribosyltransferase-isomerase QueA [Gammaproteobacteria bacterium]
MQLSDFDYQLPEELIAQAPLPERRASRMLLLDPRNEHYSDRQFADIVDLVDAGDLLVFNDTLVIPARLYGKKASGGGVEVMVERVLDDATLLAHIRASKSPKPGTELLLEGAIECVMQRRTGDLFVLRQRQGRWLDLLEQHGHVPLPPYIRRADNVSDRGRYQTVFGSKPGAVAAPTAGLHFDQEILQQLREKGAGLAQVTLHVGAGTFQPVRGDDIDSHVMHAELIDVPRSVCDAIESTRANGKRVIAVGTTVVRSLESAVGSGRLRPFRGESSLFIKPGYNFRVVDALLTNFHLPRSTLLILVSAFAGGGLIRRAYAHAIGQRYRFFSYGDAMFIANRATRGDDAVHS